MEEDEEVALQSGDSAGSGARALAGYDYQVDVSIWLALDLMLGSCLAQSIELEPGTEEDLEAELAEDEPGRVVTHVGLNGYTLVVQVKLRGGDAWTVNGIIRLLKHGSATRPSAAKRLAQPTVRYLLVTSAALNGRTRDLGVKLAGSWPKESEMSASIVKALPAGAAGRVAIIGSLDEERLILEIKRLLTERFGVPNSRWVACLRVLRDEAWLRVRHVGEGRWCREDLVEVIKNHDGFLASSPQLDDYVHPQNWRDLRDAIGTPKYAAIIIGQSGTGKTLATDKLYEELHREIPELARVRISQGPQQLRNDRTPPPVLYDIEDPWGRYNFEPTSRPWNDQLADCLSKARADRMIIATSRKDVARESGAMKSVESWIIPLEAENYGRPERQRLYRSRIKTLPRDIQLLATDSEPQVLEKLATPLEIEKFFDAMRTMGRPKRNQDQGFIRNAIAKAHENSIEDTVVQQIEERDDVRAAAIIWAFLKANNRLSLQVLRSLELELAHHLPALGDGVTPLIDFFVAARNLRSGDGNVSYYHPRVEAGVERALKRHAVPATAALRVLLDVLTEPDEEVEAWGAGVATRIVAAARRIPELTFKITPKITEKLDAWISSQLIDPACNFNEYLKLAAAAGSPRCNGAEFARFIFHRPDMGFGGFVIWGCPDHPNSWYEHLRADPAIATFAGRFIREVLPDDRTHYGKSFVTVLDRLAPELTPAYLQAAEDIIYHGFIESAETVAAGAVRDIDGFEPIVDRAVKEITTTNEQQSRVLEMHLAIKNEVYNDDYAEHLSECDESYTASEFLRVYVDRVRIERGWMSLAKHPQAAALLSYWMRSLINGTKDAPPSNNEMVGAFNAAFGSKEEDAIWAVLRRHWDDKYRERLLGRVIDGSSQDNVRFAALKCVILKMPDELSTIVDRLRQLGKDERVAELMIDLAHIQTYWCVDREKHEPETIPVMKYLDPVLLELCDAASKSSGEEQRPLSSEALSLLAKPALVSPSVRKLRISRHLELSATIRSDIECTLTHSEDRDACVEAIDAAISLGFEDIIEDSLDHKFAHVVAKALVSIGEKILGPLPANLLALVEAKGSPVRKALVQLLATNPHHDYLPVLLRLAQDHWSSCSHNYGENDNFPIARTAVKAISTLPSLHSSILEQLLEIAVKTSDHLVREELFEIIAEHGGQAFQERLFELIVAPGRKEVSLDAAHAMLVKAEVLEPVVIDMITSDILLNLRPSIASRLTLIVACQVSLPERLKIARKISANLNRRALLLLMLWSDIGNCESAVSAITQLLPCGHPSLMWVEAGPIEYAEDELIADLGEPAICQEVLAWINPKKDK
ncbi:hypothetical protein [Citrobacter sp. wls711]|uniref:nSTAND3 domain-containing NTPase n=1 Tax=Citrobacter sp. wls711 TaxID=2576425 RepID=UPI0010CA8354|nr:hypothetical protein [Citrobacter sp. wls711]TKU64234.1 hypothetical protein FDW98_07165 [Citrobacter sp. wls711]